MMPPVWDSGKKPEAQGDRRKKKPLPRMDERVDIDGDNLTGPSLPEEGLGVEILSPEESSPTETTGSTRVKKKKK